MPGHAFLTRKEHSHIDVILTDGSYHHFPSKVLDVLLRSQRVLKFKRTDGWVTVGIDPVRQANPAEVNGGYQGPERRSFH
jgi:hypothetical protein